MNKLTTLALAGLVAVAAQASASVSRWNGFGASNAYIADVQDIWTLPGVVAANKNAMYIEVGKNDWGFESGENDGSNASNNNGNVFFDLAPDSPWAGVHAEVGPGVLGIWVNRPFSEGGYDIVDNEGKPNSFGNAVSWDISVDQNVDVLYGFSLSDDSTLGVSLRRATAFRGTKNENPGGTSEETREFTDYGVGLGLEQKNVGPIALLEVGLTIDMFGMTNTDKSPAQTDKYTRSGSDIDLRVGGDLAGEKGAFGRFEVGLTMDGDTRKAEPQTAPGANNYVEAKNSGFGYNLGYAIGKSSEKGMGLAGLMIYSRSDSADMPWNGAEVDKTSYNEFRLELATGAEAKVNGWLTLRAGYSSNLFYNYTKVDEYGTPGSLSKDTTTENERWNAGGPYGYNNLSKATFGTTVTIGDLVIDGVLNQDLLYTGGYLLSGVAGVLSTQVSATWGW